MSGTGIDFTGLFHILMVLLGMYGHLPAVWNTAGMDHGGCFPDGHL